MSRGAQVLLVAGALLGARGPGHGQGAVPAAGGAADPAVSPEVVSFISERSGNRDIYRIAADGRAEQALFHTAADESNLALTPDGKYLLLSTGSADRGGRRFSYALMPLWEGDRAAGAVRPAAEPGPALFPARAVLLNPSFSPDGRRLYFESESRGLRDLFQLTLGAGPRAVGPLRQLTDNPEGNFAPAVCARGNLLAFTSSRDRVSELYRMRPDGSDLRRLTYSAGSEWQPRCHPSGERIYFVSDRDGADRIYSVHMNGSEPRRLTGRSLDSAVVEDSPTISPDGQRLAFIVRGAGMGARLHVVELGGGQEREVLIPPGQRASEPAWSLGHGGRPLRLAVTLRGEEGGSAQIFITDAQLRGVQQLTHAQGPNWHPLWIR